jgi:putative ABC transport system ATP-binding protein
LNLIAGILLPQRGRVDCAGVEVSALADRDRRNFRISTIGFVFQDFELPDYLDVLDNILHPYRITAALRLTADVRARAAELARRMDIGDKLHRPVDRLSQGEKQRVAICRALLPAPRLVLADEATGNLDPHNKVHILELLFQSVESHGAALLAVTHDHELLPHFDRVVDFSDFSSAAAWQRPDDMATVCSYS